MASGQTITSGYNYAGSCALYIGIGPYYKLNEIRNGDTVIFTGPVISDDADSEGKTVLITTIGVIHLFWGKADQLQSTVLAALSIDLGGGPETVPMPNYGRICYAVLVNCSFGNQTVPPSLKFDMERKLNLLTLSAHEITGDAVLPEVLYDMLTDSLAGAGINSSFVDTASFEEVGEIIIAEGLGVSPYFDAEGTVRDVMGQLLFYMDAFLFFAFGQIKLGLLRSPSADYTFPLIDESLLLEEPQPLHKGFDQSFSQTWVSFTDRDNKWELAMEPYWDAGNFAQTSDYIAQKLDFPYVTRRAVAKLLAKRIGAKAGQPIMTWQVTIKNLPWTVGDPAVTRLPVPGDLCRVKHSKLGISPKLCRVLRAAWAGPTSRKLKLDLQEENSRSTANDYIPPSDSFFVPHNVSPNGTETYPLVSTTPRLSTLPTVLKEGLPDGWLMAVNKPTALTLRVDMYFSSTPATGNYLSVGTSNRFPAFGTVVFWERFRSKVLVRILLNQSLDQDLLTALVSGFEETYVVTGHRSVKYNGTLLNRHEAMAVWGAKIVGGYYSAVGDLLIDLQFETGSFGTTAIALESLAANGAYPTTAIYFGQLDDFFIKITDFFNFERNAGNAPTDTDLIRAIKAPIANHQGTQPLADVSPATYDRNDTTMSPEGTLSPDWGSRAPTSAEYFDVNGGSQMASGYSTNRLYFADLDAALGRAILGTQTKTDYDLTMDITAILGAMILIGNRTIYTDLL